MSYDVTRDELGLPPSHRPKLLTPQRTLVVHYPGVDVDWQQRGHVESIRSGHLNHLRDEYNSTSLLAETAVWAGDHQGAHVANSVDPAPGHEGPVPYPTDGGNRNRYRLGHCAFVPLERPAPAEVSLTITGIRRARRAAIDAGWLIAQHNVVQHEDIATTGTPCPGWLRDPDVWARIVAPLEVVPMPDPGNYAVTIKPLRVVRSVRLNGVFALVSGRWITWPRELWTDDTAPVEVEHRWLDEQILHDQGPAGASEWRKHAGL